MINQELIELYPFLQIREPFNDEPLSNEYTHLDDMPVTWRETFGIAMCEEIKQALISMNRLEEYRILQIKEKYGELRWYGNIVNDTIDKIIAKYMELSKHISINFNF